jgi:hypothetical protein
MGKAFDATRSYQALLTDLSLLTLLAASLMLFLPRYRECYREEMDCQT